MKKIILGILISMFYSPLLFAETLSKDLEKFYFYEGSTSGFYFFKTKQDLINGKYLDGIWGNFGNPCTGIFTGNAYYTGNIKFSKEPKYKYYQEIKVIHCNPIPTLNGKIGFYSTRYAYSDAKGPFFDDPKGYSNALNRILLKAKKLNNLIVLKKLSSDFTHHPVAEAAKIAINDIRQREKDRANKNIYSIKNKYKNALSSNIVNEKNVFAVSWIENQKVDNVSYKDAITVAEYDLLIEDIYKYYDNSTIQSYVAFIKKHPSTPQVKSAILKNYNLVEQKENIAGYEWFIKTYPNAPQVKEALEKIHLIAFKEAQDIDTISAYNTFIIAYPAAAQVKEANKLAKDLEYYKYNDTLPSWFRSIMPDFVASFFNSIFGIFSSDEKKSRALLIKAKQVERDGNDYYGSKKDGYVIIANRMYGLLQEEYDDTDATLRYLESQEFKDFVRTFKSVMRGISSKLDNIANYSSEILEVSKKGFSDEKADHEMSEYYTKQHRAWEKQMHLQDKGYM